MMKSLYEELGGTYTLGEDGMYYPNLILGGTEHRPITQYIWEQISASVE